jgi:ubiquinone/menaquinone biosynthesis C-methylase UbiE
LLSPADNQAMTTRNHTVSARDGYAIWASFYDQEQNPLIMTEEPRVRELLQSLPRPSAALDVATGTGRWALYLARQGVAVTAVDQSPEMLAVARTKSRAEELEITFLERDLEDGLPLPTGTFDLVICALALSHFPDFRGLVRECGRVLRSGGHLLVTDFHPQAVKNGWEPTCFRGEEGYILPHPDHDRSDYLNAITQSGCDLVHIEEVLVREQPPESLLMDDVDAFLKQYGDWPLCLIALACRRDEGPIPKPAIS